VERFSLGQFDADGKAIGALPSGVHISMTDFASGKVKLEEPDYRRKIRTHDVPTAAGGCRRIATSPRIIIRQLREFPEVSGIRALSAGQK